MAAYKRENISGPTQWEGLGGPLPPPPQHFLKKNKIKLINSTHFQIQGIFDGIRIFNWQTSQKNPNLWLVRFGPISYGEPQNDYLYKSVLSRRLRRFHQPGDIVYAQTMESFFIKVLKSPRSYDFLKQIELDYIVHNMKKFQESPQQSMINQIVPICKLLLVNPATIAAGKGPFRQLER